MRNIFYLLCFSFSVSSFAEKFECQIEASSVIDEKSSLFSSGGYTFKVGGKEVKKLYYFFQENESYYSIEGERYPLIKIGNNYFLEKTGVGNLNLIKAMRTSKGKFVAVSKSFDFADSLMVSSLLLKCD